MRVPAMTENRSSGGWQLSFTAPTGGVCNKREFGIAREADRHEGGICGKNAQFGSDLQEWDAYNSQNSRSRRRQEKQEKCKNYYDHCLEHIL